jgi:uncharacterized membrane protein
MSFEAVLGNKEFEFVVSKVTLTVVTRRSTSGGHGVSVIVSVTGSGSDSLEAQTVSLVLITSATSLLSGSKNVFFNPKDSSYLYLLPSLLVKKICIIFRIMQHCNIFIFNFKTQWAIIRVFGFINCFPFLIPN